MNDVPDGRSPQVAACDRMEVFVKPPGGSRMPTTNSPHSLDELAALGGAIFDRQVRPNLRPEDDGKFVAIDVVTGDYEMDSDDYAAVARLRAHRPTADVWLMRAGSPTTYRMGVIR
jgi:hypothetical protein